MSRKVIASLIGLAILAVGSSAASFTIGEKQVDKKVLALQRQISGLQDQLQQKITESSETTGKPSALTQSEIDRRQQVRQASEDDLLTSAVAKITPAVVSIVISKDVPKLEVVYENPFGDDPFFQDFGMRIPVYRQNGTVRQKVGAGTGFIVSNNGYIVTNRHVVDDTNASYTVLLSNGKQLPATVVYRDSSQDLAVVKIDGSNYPTVNFGDSGSLKLGQRVIAVGNALGEYNNSVSVGIISGLDRTVTAGGDGGNTETLKGVIQTDAAINPGNSGGPLVDLNGNVIGVNVATVVGSNNISFAIPVNVIKSKISSVIK